MEKNEMDDLFDQCMEHLLTDSMLPILIAAGVVHPFKLSLGLAVKLRDAIAAGDPQPEKVITALEAEAYSQLVGASRQMIGDEQRANIKSLLRAARQQAEKDIENIRKASAAKMN